MMSGLMFSCVGDIRSDSGTIDGRHRVSIRSCGQATVAWNRGIKMSPCITECKNISMNESVVPPNTRMQLPLLLKKPVSLQKTSIRNKSEGLWVHPVN